MSQKNRIAMAALFSLLAALLIGGCGSGNKEGASQGGSALFGGVATIGDSPCIQCHSAVTDPVNGETLVSQYQMNSPHMQSGLGCESCHGGGAGHNGVGPIPFVLAEETPTQQAGRCATCHTGATAVKFKNAFGNMTTIVPPATNSTAFETSNHATNTPAHTNGLCIRCHTHEGAVLSDQSGFTGDAAVLGNAAYGPPVWGSGFTGFKCETCHQHGGGLRIVKGRDNSGNVVLWDPAKKRATNQFDLCTSCHNMYNYNQTKVIYSGTAASGTLSFVGSGPHTTSGTDWYRRIVSTHREQGMSTLLKLPFANMTSAADASNTRITGYVIRQDNQASALADPYYKGPCFDCHGHEAKTDTGSAAPAAADSTIHTDWAQSAHGGGLLTAKYAASASGLDAVVQAYVDSSTSVWSHYNWDSTQTAAGKDDRGSCQMCHTATGISNYLITQNTALTGYDPANNNFSHLIGWNKVGGSKRQNELLYCWGCHKDTGTGALRNTSQAILSFTFNSQPIVITDAGKSTACVVCHGGRGSVGQNVLNDTRSSRFDGHHAPTAGILYSEKTHIGYEYAGASYANPSFFAHDKIGVGKNGAGPCASCHMAPSASDGKPSHTFSPVTEDDTGITAINNQALCNTCHTGAHAITPAVLEEESSGYQEATTVLNNWVGNIAGYQNYLNLKISSSNINTKDADGNFVVPDNAYGAFQNGQIYGSEPCAYVHNRFYIKRLIFDAIDWMDNGVLDGHISIDAATYPEAAAWFGAQNGTAARP